MSVRNSRMAGDFGPGESGEPAERLALNNLFSVTYEELRHLASSVKRSDSSFTFNNAGTQQCGDTTMRGQTGRPLLSVLAMEHLKL